MSGFDLSHIYTQFPVSQTILDKPVNPQLPVLDFHPPLMQPIKPIPRRVLQSLLLKNYIDQSVIKTHHGLILNIAYFLSEPFNELYLFLALFRQLLGYCREV